jgi:CheY-like chemotaxis protein
MAVILLVEDEEQVRVLAESYLEEQGTKFFPQEVPMARWRS